MQTLLLHLDPDGEAGVTVRTPGRPDAHLSDFTECVPSAIEDGNIPPALHEQLYRLVETAREVNHASPNERTPESAVRSAAFSAGVEFHKV